MVSPADITVVVPSFGRHEVLVETTEQIVALAPPPGAVIIVDQTPSHPSSIENRLRRLEENTGVRRLRLDRPSQPAAMNVGLLTARTPYVLFVDDDIVPCPGLAGAHASALDRLARAGLDGSCVMGQILQPGQHVIDAREWKPPWIAFPSVPFNADAPTFIVEAAAGNLSVHREHAIAVGGFDENFKGAAHKCDTEFAFRVIRSGRRVLFEPRASVRHLKTPTGGIRSRGDYLRTWRPHFPVGSYYLALRLGLPHSVSKIGLLLLRCATTRHHLRRPWYVPATLLSNSLGLFWALSLWLRRPRLIVDGATRRTRLAPLGDPGEADTETAGVMRRTA